jgi:hypothetical protein
VITHYDFPDLDEDVARRLIVAARSIAPCIDSFAQDSEEQKNAIAIMRGVLEDSPEDRRVKTQRIGSAAVEYWNPATWLPEDRASLRSLCTGSQGLGLPRGSFPKERPISRLWRETY